MQEKTYNCWRAVMNVYKKTAENHAWRAVRDNFLPRAMDKDDCYQEAMLYMLEHQEKPKEASSLKASSIFVCVPSILLDCVASLAT